MSKEFFIIFTRNSGTPIELAKVKFPSLDEFFEHFKNETFWRVAAVISQEEKIIYTNRFKFYPQQVLDKIRPGNPKGYFDSNEYESLKIEALGKTNFLSFVITKPTARTDCWPVITGNRKNYIRTDLNDLVPDFMEPLELTPSPVPLTLLLENRLNEILQSLSQKCDSVAFGNLENSLRDLVRTESQYLTRRPNEDKWIKFCESVVAAATQSIVKN